MVSYTRQVKNKPFYDSREYNWLRENGQGVSGDLSSSGAGKVLTFTVRPYGLAVGQTVYVSGGTGTAEACEITALTGTAGAAGTCTITTANTHTGTWRVGSATAGIQEAVTALPALEGGDINVPAGRFTLYGPVTVDGKYVRILGSGFYSTWLATSYTDGNLFTWQNAGGGGMENLTIVGPNDPAADNYAVWIGVDCQRLWFRHMNVSQVASGFGIADDDNSDAINFEHTWVSYFNQYGYDIQGSNTQFFSVASAVSGTSSNAAGFRVRKTGGLTLQSCYTLFTYYGLLINPSAGGANNIWATDCIWDTPSDNGIQISPSGTGQVESAHFVNNSTNNSVDANGVFITTSNTARVESVTFIGHRASVNNAAGIVVNGERIKNLTITGSLITGNSVGTAYASDGITITPAADGPDGVTITNNEIGSNTGHKANGLYHRLAINVGYGMSPGAVDNLLITGNRFMSSSFLVLSSVERFIEGLDVITGKNVVVRDNIPEANSVRAAVEVGAVLALGGSTVSLYTATGTSAINEITPYWNGREVRIIKTDAGTKEFNTTAATAAGFRNTVTIGEGETLYAVHDGSKWNLK